MMNIIPQCSVGIEGVERLKVWVQSSRRMSVRLMEEHSDMKKWNNDF
jgi:hypothetical protein